MSLKICVPEFLEKFSLIFQWKIIHGSFRSLIYKYIGAYIRMKLDFPEIKLRYYW